MSIIYQDIPNDSKILTRGGEIVPRKRQPTQANRKLGILVVPDGVCADFDSTNCDSAGQNVGVDSPACSTAEKSTDTFSVFAGFGSTWIYRKHTFLVLGEVFL